MSTIRKQRGLTLIELVVVVAILAILAGAVVPLVSQHAANARQTAANASLVEIRNAIMGTPTSPGFLSDIGRLPYSIDELVNTSPPSSIPLFNRDTGLGWRGPYLIGANGTWDHTKLDASFTPSSYSYGNDGDLTLFDPWGSPIIIQQLKVTSDVSNTYLTYIDRNANSFVTLLPLNSLSNGDYSRLISAGAAGPGTNYVIETLPSDPLATNRGTDIVLFLNHADPHP